MTGRVALHGGGEFLPGDERFLSALIRAAAADRGPTAQPLTVAILPVAAARHRPDLAAGLGRETFDRIARAAGVEARVDAALVVDAASAADPQLAGQIEDAHLIYLPGGDPDLVPTTLAGSRAWAAGQ